MKRYRHPQARRKSRRWLATHGTIVKPDGRRIPVKIKSWRRVKKSPPGTEFYETDFVIQRRGR